MNVSAATPSSQAASLQSADQAKHAGVQRPQKDDPQAATHKPQVSITPEARDKLKAETGRKETPEANPPKPVVEPRNQRAVAAYQAAATAA